MKAASSKKTARRASDFPLSPRSGTESEDDEGSPRSYSSKPQSKSNETVESDEELRSHNFLLKDRWQGTDEFKSDPQKSSQRYRNSDPTREMVSSGPTMRTDMPLDARPTKNQRHHLFGKNSCPLEN